MADVNSNDQPSAAQQTLAKSINDLADEDLAKIFKYLSPKRRLRVMEVCKRWNQIGQIPWHDVVSLDLTPFVEDSTKAIIKRCPNIQNVLVEHMYFSAMCWSGKNGLRALSFINLASVKLYNCSSHPVLQAVGAELDVLLRIFAANLPHASWDELVLHGFNTEILLTQPSCACDCLVVATLPASLKRLQLSGGLKVKFVGPRGNWVPTESRILDGVGRLQHLTCLIICSLPTYKVTLIESALLPVSMFQGLSGLKSLVEVCIGWPTDACTDWSADIMHFCFELPKLEVAFLHNVYLNSSEEYLEKVLTKHPTLRILVMTGRFSEEAFEQEPVPARRLYPSGFGSAPLPFLHVFLGSSASRALLFTTSSSDALKVYPITEGLPSFLEKDEIAPIFEGVWIAGQVKEGAKHGAKLCESEGDQPATSIRVVEVV